jgi:hypothetical protein
VIVAGHCFGMRSCGVTMTGMINVGYSIKERILRAIGFLKNKYLMNN